MSTLTLRLNDDVSNELEIIKEHFGVKTASGAISLMISDYLQIKEQNRRLSGSLALFRESEEILRLALETLSQQTIFD